LYPASSSFGIDLAFDHLAWNVDPQTLSIPTAIGTEQLAAPMFDMIQSPLVPGSGPALLSALGGTLAAGR
jgi:hypothetical protein